MDHKHREDGKKCGPEDVRGLLCTKCNTKVGHLEKDAYTTYSALAYLGNPQDRYPGVRREVAVRFEKREHRKKFAQKELQVLADQLEKMLTVQLPGAMLSDRD